jgi:hypothetical protein
MKYTKRDGEIVVFFLKRTLCPSAKLIGSLYDKGESDHDIDILLEADDDGNIEISDFDKTYSVSIVTLGNWDMFGKVVMKLLEAKSYEKTDWGGYYFHDTFFGDIDIFFSTKDFDY